MPYVRNKISWGSERLYYILQPLMREDFGPRGGGKYKEREMKEIFNRVKIEAQNRRKTGRLEMYRIYHENLKPAIKDFKDRKNRLVTGLSVDFSEPSETFGMKYPAKFGMDWTSPMAKFYEEFLRGINEVIESHRQRYNELLTGYRKEVIHPVSPVMFPFTFVDDDGKIGMDHAAVDAIEKVDASPKERGKLTFGSLKRTLDRHGPAIGNFEFSVKLFSAEIAKRLRTGYESFNELSEGFIKRSVPFLTDSARENVKELLDDYPKNKSVIQKLVLEEYDGVIEKSTYLNRQMMASAIENALLKPLEIKRIDVIAMNTSYVWGILHFIDGVEFNCWDLMRGAKRGYLGEADPASIGRIQGGFYADWKRLRA